MNIQLRPWQQDATAKALSWLLDPAGGKHFLINAAPGAGKTLCASVIAQKLLSMGEIDRVVVIDPPVRRSSINGLRTSSVLPADS